MISVVFDLDGTLVDSIESIAQAANALMSELDLKPLDAEETRSYVGNGAAHFLELALRARHVWSEAEASKTLNRFLFHYAAVPGAASPPLAGVKEALDHLAEGGHALAVCTNKPTAPTEVILEAHGWSQMFEALVCGDTLSQRKPDPAPLHEAKRLLGGGAICFVGDSEVDAATAAAANVPFFLYTQGYRHTHVDALPHTAHFDDFVELPKLIRTYCP